MKSESNGFSLMELMVVVLIIGVLAGIAIPILQGKVDKSKWTEANTAAAMIRNAATAYYAETGVKLSGSMSKDENLNALKITESDLYGTYFQAANYNIDDVTDNGVAIITVTATRTNGPTGSKTFYPDGTFE